MHHLVEHKLHSEFSRLVAGFLDTLSAAKQVIRKCDIPTGKYNQESLVQAFVSNPQYNAHNAVDDVLSLQKLYETKLNLQANELEMHVFAVNYHQCFKSLSTLVKDKVLSVQTQRKLACVGLGLSQLRVIHRRDPEGIQGVFKQPFGTNMRPRVSSSRKLINKVVQYLD